VRSPITPKEIFRAYDVRGIVGDTLTLPTVREIGRALGTLVLRAGEKTLVVARDGRLSSNSLQKALCAGILSTGCNVIDIGMVPTPILYFATHFLKISSGVMITGSHNPPDYNGFKIMLSGKALYGEGILALYTLIQEQAFSQGTGKNARKEIIGTYIDVIKQDVQLRRPLKVVVDCGNGAASVVAPLLYETLGCTVIPLFCEVDGRFPNHHPDPGQPKNLQHLIQTVHQHQADIGLAFDGDGDRLGVVDNNGNIIWPDRQLILFAQEVLSSYPGAGVIFDVKCTRHVAERVVKCGGKPLMWKTGHSLIKAKMQETGALLAGEMSGHVFFKDRWFGFDDALYAGARLLEIISKEISGKTVAEMFDLIPNSVATPELHINVTEHNKFSSVEKLVDLAQRQDVFEDAKMSTLDGLRVDFEDGFGLIRPSNTGPYLILRFEGDTPEVLLRIQAAFGCLLRAVEPQWELPF
jgi:phosphomannomutase/phosphoglucomutase